MPSLQDLWQERLDKLSFRHPDPTAHVIVGIQDDWGEDNDSSVAIRFQMYNLKDTKGNGNIISRQPQGFYWVVRVNYWPGEEWADLILLGGWLLYIQHEAQELVTIRGSAFVCSTPGCFCGNGTERRVQDPHAEGLNYLMIYRYDEFTDMGVSALKLVMPPWVTVRQQLSDRVLKHLYQREESYG